MVFEFSQKLYYYYINLLVVNNWGGTKLCRYSKFKSFSPQSLRMNSLGNTLVENGGWHFSYIGGNEMIKYKLESFAETQLNTDEIKDSVDDRVTNGISIFDKHQKFMQVEIDLSYPKHILDNLEKYNHLIKKQ